MMKKKNTSRHYSKTYIYMIKKSIKKNNKGKNFYILEKKN